MVTDTIVVLLGRPLVLLALAAAAISAWQSAHSLTNDGSWLGVSGRNWDIGWRLLWLSALQCMATAVALSFLESPGIRTMPVLARSVRALRAWGTAALVWALMWATVETASAFFALPALLVMSVAFTAVPVAIAESHGTLMSFKRSYELTRSHLLRILALVGCMSAAALALERFAIPWLNSLHLSGGDAAMSLAAPVMQTLTIVLLGIMAGATYRRLRAVAEHQRLARLRAVFE